MSRTPEDTPPTTATPPAGGRRFDRLHVILMVLLGVLLGALASAWLVTAYLFPAPFEPVVLSPPEQQRLEAKLQRIESLQRQRGRVRGRQGAARRADGPPALSPEPYSEADARREIDLTERELNALLANNTDLAQRLAIDLSDDLLSAKLLLPLDPDFPVLGGKTLKVHAGLELAYRNGRPVVVLKGVSVMGVPLPNAWLGNLKNIDLVQTFGDDGGFWSAFAAGIDHIRVQQGRLSITLKE